MSGMWTVMALDLCEVRRKRLVLVLGLLAVLLVTLTALVGIVVGFDVGVSVADLALRNIHQIMVVLAVIQGAAALSEQSNLEGLVVRPIPRSAVVMGRFLALLLLLAALVGACAGVAVLARGLAGGGLDGIAGTLRTAGVTLLNGLLAGVVAMALSLWLPWLAAAVVAWLTLSGAQVIFQLTVIGPILGFPAGVTAAARMIGFFLPHVTVALDGGMLPAGTAMPGVGWQVARTGAWVIGLILLTGLRFRRRDL
ncbi:MAG TPA: hypothetical protein VNT01_09195 [Symbiobacteriaceae bacterium]|nr:hypothetical protein [Symbiobacteriaceae bacterium]